PVSVTIQDEGGATLAVIGTATVADAPLSALPVNISGTVGVPLANVLLALYVDAGGPEPAGNYSVSLDWGDNSGADQGTVNGPGPLFGVTGSHIYASAGTFIVHVNILDEGGSLASISLSASIAPAASPPPAGSGTSMEAPYLDGRSPARAALAPVPC